MIVTGQARSQLYLSAGQGENIFLIVIFPFRTRFFSLPIKNKTKTKMIRFCLLGPAHVTGLLFCDKFDFDFLNDL